MVESRALKTEVAKNFSKLMNLDTGGEGH